MSLSEKYTRSVILKFLLKVFSFGSTIVYLFLLARVTTRPTFGVLGFITIIRGVIPRITSFGIHYYIINKASNFIVKDESVLIHKSYHETLKLYLFARLPITLLLSFFLFLLNGFIQSNLPTVIMMSLFFVFNILFHFFRSWLRAFLKVKYALILASIPSIFSSFLSLILYLLFKSLISIVTGWMVVYLIAGILAFIKTRKALKKVELKGGEEMNEEITWTRILQRGSGLYFLSLASLLAGKLDQIFSAFFLTPVVFATYYAMFRIIAGIFNIGMTIKGEMLSVFSHLKQRDPTKMKPSCSLVFKIIFIYSIGTVSIAGLFPRFLIFTLLGGKYLNPLAIQIFLVLLTGTFFRLLLLPIKSIRKVTGELKTLLIAELIAISIKGFLIGFLYSYGALGIAIAFLMMLLFQFLFLGIFSRKWINIRLEWVLKAILPILPVFLFRIALFSFSLHFFLSNILFFIISFLLFVISLSRLKLFEKEEIKKIKESSPSFIKKLVPLLLGS